jgi:hypothetical protein
VSALDREPPDPVEDAAELSAAIAAARARVEAQLAAEQLDLAQGLVDRPSERRGNQAGGFSAARDEGLVDPSARAARIPGSLRMRSRCRFRRLGWRPG